MQSVTKQIETRAIRAYQRARAMGSNAAQLALASTLPLTATSARAKFARTCSKVGLAELAVNTQFNHNPSFVSAVVVQEQYLALRSVVRSMGAYTPYREVA